MSNTQFNKCFLYHISYVHISIRNVFETLADYKMVKKHWRIWPRSAEARVHGESGQRFFKQTSCILRNTYMFLFLFKKALVNFQPSQTPGLFWSHKQRQTCTFTRLQYTEAENRQQIRNQVSVTQWISWRRKRLLNATVSDGYYKKTVQCSVLPQEKLQYLPSVQCWWQHFCTKVQGTLGQASCFFSEVPSPDNVQALIFRSTSLMDFSPYLSPGCTNPQGNGSNSLATTHPVDGTSHRRLCFFERWLEELHSRSCTRGWKKEDDSTTRELHGTHTVLKAVLFRMQKCEKFNYRQATSVSSVIVVLFLLISHPSTLPRVGPVTWSIYTAAAAFVFTITGQTALVQGACAVTFLHQWGRQRAGAE